MTLSRFMWNGASVVLGRVSATTQNCLPQESALVKDEMPARQLEFTAGRNLAREAAREFGTELGPILHGNYGEPLFPEALVGSISHAGGWIVAAVGLSVEYQSLGIDLDDDRQISPSVARTIASKRELSSIVAAGWTQDPQYAANLAFCAKEAFFKCQCPITGIDDLDFLDVELKRIPGTPFMFPRAKSAPLREATKYARIESHDFCNFRVTLSTLSFV
jgi:4'-phosphopantetheinyl transferase EntD